MFRLFMQNSMSPPVYSVTDALSQSDITLVCVIFGRLQSYIALNPCENSCFMIFLIRSDLRNKCLEQMNLVYIKHSELTLN